MIKEEFTIQLEEGTIIDKEKKIWSVDDTNLMDLNTLTNAVALITSNMMSTVTYIINITSQ